MERRVLLAVFLSFLVLFTYQLLLPRPEPRPPAEVVEEIPRPAPAPAPVPPDPMVEADPAAAEEAPEPLVADADEREIVVETDQVRAVFSTRGAELVSWRLQNHLNAAGEPLELVPSDIPAERRRPFTISVGDPLIDARLRQALYRPSSDTLRLHERGDTLVFEYRDAAGLQARKEFGFAPQERPFTILFSASVSDGDRPLTPAVHWGPGIGDEMRVASGFYYSQPPGAILSREGSVSRLKPADVAAEPRYEGVFDFVGVDDHYFLSALLPGDRPLGVEYEQVPVRDPATGTQRDLVAYTVRLPAAPHEELFFFGPKDFDLLANIDRGLVRAVHFGFLGPLVVPLLHALKGINSYVGNYGWSIVILTILINAAMFPLRHKSVVSMRKLQELQPEMKAIQERYGKLKATDPARQKMNVELMNLYRERGVNPASGCLPMLLTMPVLFAFYSLLSVAIEIRDAPFILWIRDLSSHDPYYVTPILMGATMVLQQKMMPTTADPMQQKIMMIMPVVFTFLFLWAPSGLVLYWFVSNLWAIGQQHLTNKIIGPPAVRTVRPPAERRVKRVGAGRSEQAARSR